MQILGQEQLYRLAYNIFIFILIIAITFIIVRISKTLIDRAMRSSSPYLVAHVKHYASMLLWAIGVILGIRQMGISTDILILLMGLAGIGFIVSAIYVLQNMISRSFLNLHMQYKVGDVISIKNYSGKVIEISDLNTVLLGKDGNLITVPNIQFMKEVWIKHGVALAGYEITIPIVIDKKIDAVNFEKELLNSIRELQGYFKKEPGIVTSKTNEKTVELALILNLKDPEKKSVITVEISEIVNRLIAEFKEKTEKEKKENEIKEIKDISHE